MAKLPPFWPPSENGFSSYDSAPPRVAIPPLVLRRMRTPGTCTFNFYKILGFLGPRGCTGGRTCIWRYCAAGCMHPTQWPIHAARTALQVLAVCQCKHQTVTVANGKFKPRKYTMWWSQMPNTQLANLCQMLSRRGIEDFHFV